MPWAGPLLRSWAGLLGHRELRASGQRCREPALPRSSSSAKRSRAEGTACRHRGQRSGRARRAQRRRNLHRTSHSPHAESEQMSNGSSITEFLLLTLTARRELQLLHFWLFLAISLAALLGTGLIITAIACNHHLHTPVYFFLLNLSLLHLVSISTPLPKAMANSLWDNRGISCSGCAAQAFLFLFLVTAEFCLLTIMCYNRYVATCNPLRYGTLLGSRACVHMAAAAWGTGLLNSLLHTANTFSLSFYQGETLEHFFCEIPQILKLSRSRSYLREVGLIMVTACLFLGWFVFVVGSYVQIFRAVLRRGWEEPAGKGTQDWRGVRDTLGKNSWGGSGAAPL